MTIGMCPSPLEKKSRQCVHAKLVEIKPWHLEIMSREIKTWPLAKIVKNAAWPAKCRTAIARRSFPWFRPTSHGFGVHFLTPVKWRRGDGCKKQTYEKTCKIIINKWYAEEQLVRTLRALMTKYWRLRFRACFPLYMGHEQSCAEAYPLPLPA